ncbi:MAG: hypothetical protein HZA51_06255 [Planctomycetes bacterium]|nr:hypothetical protein [Planctomycetota bacterium]
MRTPRIMQRPRHAITCMAAVVFVCLPILGCGLLDELLTGDEPDLVPGDTASGDAMAGLSDQEIAYLTLLFTRAGLPFDLNNIPADTDGDAYPNGVDEDADGDGIVNVDDDDIDGDGIKNTEDADIDGDRLLNDEDPDIDADGVENDDDFDADSDGLSDRFDLNDDGDDEPDDEDEDDMADEPKTGLEDLADRLKRGALSENDKNRIVDEILKRLDSQDLKNQLQAALVDIVAQATDPDRLARPLTVPAGVDAIDQLYEQLDDAIKEAKRGQFNPNGPFQNRARERKAAEDMVLRARTMATIGRTFPTMLIDDINESTKKLRSDMGPERLLAFTQGMRDHVNPNAIGGIGSEKRELDALTLGGSVMGKSFSDADPEDIFDGIERLRSRAVLADPSEGTTAKYSRLLNRLSEIKQQSAGKTLNEAVTQVVMEDGGP